MNPATLGACIILGLVGLLNLAYAGLRISNGALIEENLPLLTGGLVCFSLIVLFACQGSKKKD